MDKERFVFEQRLEKLVRFSPSKNYKYILKEDVESLNLSLDERRLVYRILFERMIDIRVDVVVNDRDISDKNIFDYVKFASYKYWSDDINLSSNMTNELFMVMHDTNCPDKLKKKIRARLIEANMKYVDEIALKCSKIYNIDCDELKSYGYKGLILAVDSFDANSPFSSYVQRGIYYSVRSGVDVNYGLNHHSFLSEKYFNIKSSIEEVYGISVLDNPQLIFIIIDELGKKYKVNKMMLNYLLNSILINNSIAKGNVNVMYNIDDILDKRELVSSVKKILSDNFNERTCKVLESIYGLNGEECRNFSKIGNELGLSRERIRQINANSLKKLKQPVLYDKLKDYVK